MEQAAVVGPYLATAASAVSKAVMGPGTIIAEVVLPDGVRVMQPLWSLHDNSGNDGNSLVCRANSGGTGILGVSKIGGVQTAGGPTTPLASATLARVAVAWDETGFTVCVDGQTTTSASLGWAMWHPTHLTLGRLPTPGVPGGYLNRMVRKMEYRPARIPAATLRTLTAP